MKIRTKIAVILTLAFLMPLLCGPALAKEKITALQNAVRKGDLGLVKSLIAAGANVNVDDSRGKSPLYYAAESCVNKDIIEYLINHGAKIDKINLDGNTPLSAAANAKCAEAAKALVDHGADVNRKLLNGFSLLHAAAVNNAAGVAEILIKAGADVNARDRLGETPLHYCLSPYSRELALLLIEHGADIDAKTNDGETPLYRASRERLLGPPGVEDNKKQDEVVEFLLESGAKEDVFSAAVLGDDNKIKAYLADGGDPNARIQNGDSLLDDAALVGSAQIIDMLLSHGAKVNGVSTDNTPLYFAVLSGNIDAVTTLLKHGADISLKSKYNGTPLHAAATALHPNQKIIDALISNGAKMDIYDAVCLQKIDFIEDYIKNGGDLNKIGPDGYTSLYTAITCNKKEIVKLLLEKGADPNTAVHIDEGLSDYPLHNAARGLDETGIVSLLLEHGADVNRQNSQKMTPLHWAAYLGNVGIAEFLISHGADVNIKMENGKTPLEITNKPKMEELLISHGARE